MRWDFLILSIIKVKEYDKKSCKYNEKYICEFVLQILNYIGYRYEECIILKYLFMTANNLMRKKRKKAFV